MSRTDDPRELDAVLYYSAVVLLSGFLLGIAAACLAYWVGNVFGVAAECWLQPCQGGAA